MLVKRPGIGRLKALNCCTHRPMNPDSDEILHWNQYLCPWLQSVVKWSKGLLSILVIKFNLSYKQLIQSGKIELKLPKHGMTLREVDRWNIYSWWRNSEAEKEVLVIVLAPHSIRSKMDQSVFAPFFLYLLKKPQNIKLSSICYDRCSDVAGEGDECKKWIASACCPSPRFLEPSLPGLSAEVIVAEKCRFNRHPAKK